MDAEQLQAAYDTAYATWFVNNWVEENAREANAAAHLAGLTEVARQQAEHDAQIAEPAGEDLRMDAYYYGFTRTGVGIVDRILSAVACAGKAFHMTERWIDYPYGEEGKTPEEWIQDAANSAAAAIRAQFENVDRPAANPITATPEKN